MAAKRKKKSKRNRFELRIRPEEKTLIEEAAARATGPDGRPLSASAWARSVLLTAAERR